MRNKKFWRWKNQSENEGAKRTLVLDGTIAEESWFDDEITPQEFKDELFSSTGEVIIWINSPGGDCIAASRIYAMLMDYPDEITVKIDGIAASAASVIAMAGTKVMMAPTALMMIHNPATFAFGDHEDMKKAISMLEEVKESIINAYEIKTSLDRGRISSLMNSETWMNAQKAIDLGFADELLEDAKKSLGSKAYAFSTKNTQVALLNKINEKLSDQSDQGNLSVSFEELERRLNLIKPQ